METFAALPVDSPHKDQWRRALVFSAPEQNVEQTIESRSLWRHCNVPYHDAIMLRHSTPDAVPFHCHDARYKFKMMRLILQHKERIYGGNTSERNNRTRVAIRVLNRVRSYEKCRKGFEKWCSAKWPRLGRNKMDQELPEWTECT